MHLICALLAAPTLPHYCQEKQFHCTSGECIPIRFVCDGDSDCKDHSDELQEQCRFRGEFNKWEKRCKMGKRKITKDSFFLRFLSATTSNVASSSFTNEFCSNPQFQTLTKGSPWKLTKKMLIFLANSSWMKLCSMPFFYLASMCVQVCVYVDVCVPTPGPKSRSTGFGVLGLGFGLNEWTQLCAQRYVHSLTHSNLLSVICSFSI